MKLHGNRGLGGTFVPCRRQAQSFRSIRRCANRTSRPDPDSEDSSAFLTNLMDKLIDTERKQVEISKQKMEEMDRELEAAQAANSTTPKLLIRALRWVRNLNGSVYERQLKTLEAMEKNREEYLQELQGLNQRAASNESTSYDVADYAMSDEGAVASAAGVIAACIVQATIISWIASFFGIELSALLHDPAVPTGGALLTWTAWTVPYAGAAGIAAAFAPSFIGNRGTVRRSDTDSLFGKNSPVTLTAMAVGLGYAQATIYQGVWLLVSLRIFGAGVYGFDADPFTWGGDADVDAALGSLVAAPILAPALLKLPAAVLLAAAIETGTWIIDEALTRFDPTATTDVSIESATAMVLSSDIMQQFLDKEELEDAMKAGQLSPEKLMQLQRGRKLSEDEYWATLGRVALSSVYMGAETLATGNLWNAVLTGTVGLAIGIFARRSVCIRGVEGAAE
jgi:hypothetical protein